MECVRGLDDYLGREVVLISHSSQTLGPVILNSDLLIQGKANSIKVNASLIFIHSTDVENEF